MTVTFKETTDDERMSVTFLISLAVMVWPTVWLLLGIGPSLRPLWVLIGFYIFTMTCLLLIWAVVMCWIDEFLERHQTRKPE